ncbi:uncharacterized protein LOC124820037 [Vigna umbellata]|uniref:uncharacterized protein LOC124820037 n=1 Tax=Vigna umbellata TaxID=87088 RepID=UPI001F5F8A1A|nr:uncharacterized protein LOC124820037 [Vigna umbellata]
MKSFQYVQHLVFGLFIRLHLLKLLNYIFFHERFSATETMNFVTLEGAVSRIASRTRVLRKLLLASNIHVADYPNRVRRRSRRFGRGNYIISHVRKGVLMFQNIQEMLDSIEIERIGFTRL